MKNKFIGGIIDWVKIIFKGFSGWIMDNWVDE